MSNPAVAVRLPDARDVAVARRPTVRPKARLHTAKLVGRVLPAPREAPVRERAPVDQVVTAPATRADGNGDMNAGAGAAASAQRTASSRRRSYQRSATAPGDSPGRASPVVRWSSNRTATRTRAAIANAAEAAW